MAITQGVQTSYEQNIAKGYPGQIADLQDRIVESFAAEGAVAFGTAVQKGTDPDKQVKTVTTGGVFAGMAIRDIARENNSSAVAEYADKETVGMMTRGFMYARIDGTGVAGDTLTAIVDTGQLSTAGVDATHLAAKAELAEACAVSGSICKVWIYQK